MSATMHMAVGIVIGAVTLLHHFMGSSPKDTPLGKGYYHKVWFWDELGHSMAGMSLGLFTYGLFSYLTIPTTYVVPVVFVIAILWEVYEVVAWDMRKKMREYRWRHDTLSDIAFVMCTTQLMLLYAV